MSQTSIGKAALVLSADASAAKAGLAQFVKDTKKAAAEAEGGFDFHKTEKKLDKAFQKYAKHEGGFLGTLGGGVLGDLGLGGSAAAAVGVVLAVKQIGSVIDDATGRSRDFDKAIEKGKSLSEELARAMARVRAESAEWTAALTDPGAKLTKLTGDVKAAEADLAASRAAEHAAREKIESLDSYRSGESWQLWLGRGLEDTKKAATSELDGAKEQVKVLGEHLAGLRKDKLRLADPTADPVLTGEYARKLKEVRDAVDDIGKTAGEKLTRPFTERGLPKDWSDRLRKLGDVKEIEEKMHELRGAIDDVGKTAGEKLARPFADRGVPASITLGLRKLGDVKEVTEKVRELKDEIADIGLTGGDKLARAFAGFDVPPKLFDELKALGDAKEKLEKKFEANKSFDEFLADMRVTAQTVGLSADQVRIFRAQLDGVDSSKLAQAAGLMNVLNGSKSVGTTNAALDKGSTAEVTARLNYQAGGAAEKQLAETRRTNTLLIQANTVLKAVSGQLGGAAGALMPI